MHTFSTLLFAAAASTICLTGSEAASSFKNDDGSWTHVSDSWDAFDKAFDDFDSRFSDMSKSIDATVAAAEARAKKAEEKAMKTMEKLQRKYGSNSSSTNSTEGGNTFVGGTHNVIFDSSSPDKPDVSINGKGLNVSGGGSVKSNSSGTYVIKSGSEGKACMSAVSSRLLARRLSKSFPSSRVSHLSHNGPCKSLRAVPLDVPQRGRVPGLQSCLRHVRQRVL